MRLQHIALRTQGCGACSAQCVAQARAHLCSRPPTGPQAAVVFPTASTLKRLREVAEGPSPPKLVLIVNPQWEGDGACFLPMHVIELQETPLSPAPPIKLPAPPTPLCPANRQEDQRPAVLGF